VESNKKMKLKLVKLFWWDICCHDSHCMQCMLFTSFLLSSSPPVVKIQVLMSFMSMWSF